MERFIDPLTQPGLDYVKNMKKYGGAIWLAQVRREWDLTRLDDITIGDVGYFEPWGEFMTTAKAMVPPEDGWSTTQVSSEIEPCPVSQDRIEHFPHWFPPMSFLTPSGRTELPLSEAAG